MNPFGSMKPLKRNVLVKLLPLYSEAKIGNLTLMVVDKKKHWDHPTRRAEVLATGPQVHEVSVGDTVLFAGGEGKWVNDPDSKVYENDAKYLMINEKNIMAVECAQAQAAA